MNLLKIQKQIVRTGAKAALSVIVFTSKFGKQTPAKKAIRILWDKASK